MKADAHIHLLPGMDSGPVYDGVAAEMLLRLYERRVRLLVATPHYFADRESVSEFVLRRRQAIQRLKLAFGPKFRNVCLLPSAEVMLMSGVSDVEALASLAIPGTNLLPVVFPIGGSIPDALMREVARMVQRLALCPMFCHVERYLPFYGERFDAFLGMNHAAFLLSPHALTLPELAESVAKALRQGARIFLGSNAHDLCLRPPTVEAEEGYNGAAAYAYRAIRKSTDDFFTSLAKNGVK